MRTKVAILAGVGLLVAAGVAPVIAHHAFSAEFDANRPLHMEGKVVKMEVNGLTHRVYLWTAPLKVRNSE